MKKEFNPRQPNRNVYYEFLNEALQTIRCIKDKDIKEQRRQGEQLLDSNLDKLDDKFSKILRSWAKDELLTTSNSKLPTVSTFLVTATSTLNALCFLNYIWLIATFPQKMTQLLLSANTLLC